MKKAVITYGRFNPPTIGHERMFNKLIQTAKNEGADPFIIVSHSQDAKKNPLSPGEKMRYIKTMFPEATVLQTTKQEFNPDFIIKRLRKLDNYTDFKMVLGGDRVEKGNFKWLKINIVSGGERNNSGNGAAAMSATKARAAAVSGNRNAFRRAISSKISNSNVNNMMQKISSRMSAAGTKKA